MAKQLAKAKEENKAHTPKILESSHSPPYYVEFIIKQQRNFDQCIIDKQIVVVPERLICLSNILIKDIRKFVFYRVLDKFSQLHPNNIDLAYRHKSELQDDSGRFNRQYKSLSHLTSLTIDDMIKNQYWQRKKCDLQYKEDHNIPFAVPKYIETLYVRFI